MLDLWQSLSPELKTVLCSTIAGVIIWAIQRFWTNCPFLPLLGPDSSTARKRLAACLLSIATGIAAAAADGGNVQTGISAAIAAYTASQTAYLSTRG